MIAHSIDQLAPNFLTSSMIKNRQAVCLITQREIICYADQNREWHISLLNQASDDVIIDEVLFCLKEWQTVYLTLIIDSADELLAYEQTPSLYAWEIELYARKQTSKRFTQLKGVTGYRYRALGKGRWIKSTGYLLISFSISGDGLITSRANLLIARLQQSEIWLTSILSLYLLLNDFIVFSQQKNLKKSLTTKGQIWLIHCQYNGAMTNQIKQLLSYQSLPLIQRSVLLNDHESSDHARQIADENALLHRFLQMQISQQQMTKTNSTMNQALLDAQVQPIEIAPQHLAIHCLTHFPNRSDYQISQTMAWKKLITWVNSSVLFLLLMLTIISVYGVMLYWQQHILQNEIIVISESLHQLQESDSVDTVLSKIPSNISPELLQARVDWMRDWYLLKMNADPSDLLLNIATLLVDFPAITLSSLSYDNGPTATSAVELLDISQSSLRLTAQINAQYFKTLGEEANGIKIFLSRLAELSGVKKVELLRNPVLSLQDQGMTVVFSASQRDEILHSLVVLLHLSPRLSMPQE